MEGIMQPASGMDHLCKKHLQMKPQGRQRLKLRRAHQVQYWRRFARREAGKRVKGYSATDLAAILGGGASEAETKATASAAPKATVPPAHAEEPVSSSGEPFEGIHRIRGLIAS